MNIRKPAINAVDTVKLKYPKQSDLMQLKCLKYIHDISENKKLHLEL